jgi:hypothetical protein
MTYAFDAGVLQALTALAASAGRAPLAPAALDRRLCRRQRRADVARRFRADRLRALTSY